MIYNEKSGMKMLYDKWKSNWVHKFRSALRLSWSVIYCIQFTAIWFGTRISAEVLNTPLLSDFDLVISSIIAFVVFLIAKTSISKKVAE